MSRCFLRLLLHLAIVHSQYKHHDSSDEASGSKNDFPTLPYQSRHHADEKEHDDDQSNDSWGPPLLFDMKSIQYQIPALVRALKLIFDGAGGFNQQSSLQVCLMM